MSDIRKLEAFTLGLIVGCAALAITLFTFSTAARATTIYNPHSVPQPNTITGSMLVNNTLGPAQLDLTQSYTFATNTAYTQNDGSFTATTSAKLPQTVTFGSYTVTMPTVDGSNGQILQTNGSGVLSFATNSINTTSYTATSSENINTPQAVSYASTSTQPYFIGVSQNNQQSIGTTAYFPYTTVSGRDRILLCMVENYSDTTHQPTSVQYASTTMTFINKAVDSTERQDDYYILNPATGNNNVFVQEATSLSVAVQCIQYNSVIQQAPVKMASSTTTGVASITTTIASHQSADIIDVAFAGDNGNPMSGGTNCNARISGTDSLICDSNGVIGSAGSFAMTSNYTAGNANMVQISLQAEPPSSPGMYLSTTATSTTEHTNFVGFASANSTAGNPLTIITSGTYSGFTNLVPGSEYFLSDTPGAISTVQGTNKHVVGTAVSSTTLIMSNIF